MLPGTCLRIINGEWCVTEEAPDGTGMRAIPPAELEQRHAAYATQRGRAGGLGEQPGKDHVH